jgi:quercetin dioxygenase-like cupin family protein
MISRRRFSGLAVAMVAGLAAARAGAFASETADHANAPRASRRGFKGMEIKRVGSQPSAKGLSDWFTGTVRIDPLFQAPDQALVQCASVTFEPGARTAWHTHPLGQILIVTGGCGWAQHWGGAIEEIRPGDVVWFSTGEKHWHGAAPATAMTHIAIQSRFRKGRTARSSIGWNASPTSNTALTKTPDRSRQGKV